MALTAALPIVSFADETTAAVKEDKMVVRIIHLDENGNLLEEDKQTATEETESSEETTDKEEANADEAVAEADSDEEEAGPPTPARPQGLRQKPTRQRQNLRQLSKLRMISVPKLLHMRSSS